MKREDIRYKIQETNKFQTTITNNQECLDIGIWLLGIVCLLSLVTWLLLPHSVFADFIRSSNYEIQGANLNIGSTKFTSPTTGTKISSTLGQTAAEQFSSAGYLVRAGFQYIYSIAPFSFTISSINIPFGSLTPGTPATATTNLTVGFSSANGYQVTAREDDTLKTLAGTAIADTACDVGTPCTITSANTWSLNSTYGFGYNMSSGSYPNDIPADFTAASKYRPFANLALSHNPATVMSANNTTTPAHLYRSSIRQSTVTFKINVSSTQAAGTYTTVVRFTATSLY